VADVKETDFFVRKWKTHSYRAEFLQWSPGEIAADISPTYYLLPERAVEAISSTYRDARVLMILREPVERLWSHLILDFTRDSWLRVPREKIAEIPEAVLLPLAAVYDSMCRYDVLLGHWLAHHPGDRVLIEWFDTIAEAPDLAMERIAAFLGVAFPAEVLRRKVNALGSAAIPPPPRIAAFLHELHAVRAERLATFLRGRLGIEVPTTWHRPLPATPLDPMLILGDFQGSDIHYFSGAYHRVPAGEPLTAAVAKADGFLEALGVDGLNHETASERMMWFITAQQAVAAGQTG
jgi:Sulfotransferase family